MQENTLSFDELLELASNDPVGLERYRQEQIEAVINEAPEYLRHRLQGLQFQIDAQRQIHKNPLGLCIKLSQMMNESFNQLHDLLNQCADPAALLAEEDTRSAPRPSRTAKVIPFPAGEQRNRTAEA